MTTAQLTTLESPAAAQVLRWRLRTLLEAGYLYVDALKLAMDGEVDLHAAASQIRRGCERTLGLAKREVERRRLERPPPVAPDDVVPRRALDSSASSSRAQRPASVATPPKSSTLGAVSSRSACWNVTSSPRPSFPCPRSRTSAVRRTPPPVVGRSSSTTSTLSSPSASRAHRSSNVNSAPRLGRFAPGYAVASASTPAARSRIRSTRLTNGSKPITSGALATKFESAFTS